MKLLFDADISQRLVENLKDEFPGSAHVKDFGLQSADDETITQPDGGEELASFCRETP